MTYSAKLIRSLRNPRKIGSSTRSRGCRPRPGRAPACADSHEDEKIKVGPDGLIEDAKFYDLRLRLGDCLELRSSRVGQGKTVDEAETIKNTDIAKPPGAAAGDRFHSQVRAEDAIQGGDCRLSGQDGQEGRNPGSRAE